MGPDDSMEALLKELERRGVKLTDTWDRLIVTAPPGVLSEEATKVIAFREREILHVMRGEWEEARQELILSWCLSSAEKQDLLDVGDSARGEARDRGLPEAEASRAAYIAVSDELGGTGIILSPDDLRPLDDLKPPT